MASSDSQIDKVQRGRSKRAELRDVNKTQASLISHANSQTYDIKVSFSWLPFYPLVLAILGKRRLT